MTVLTFGKYKGTELNQLPIDYLQWGAEKLSSPKWQQAFINELKRRESDQVQEEERLIHLLEIGQEEEVRAELRRKAWVDWEIEAEESGCPWEYQNISSCDLEEEVTKKIGKLRLAILEKHFMSEMQINREQMEKVQFLYWNKELRRSHISTPEKYEKVISFLKEYDNLFDKVYRI